MTRVRVRGLNERGVIEVIVVRAPSMTSAILHAERRGLQVTEAQMLSPSPWSTVLWCSFASWTIFMAIEFWSDLDDMLRIAFLWFVFSLPMVYPAIVTRWRIN